MLVISRKLEEGLLINGNIEIRIFNVFSNDQGGGKKSKVASIGIDAPRDIQILRKELLDTMEQNREAEESVRNLADTGLAVSGLAGMLKQKRKLPGSPPESKN